ncbi:MAG: flagellar hook-associated protein FlgK [Burkholderiales bacterium]|nr:flagellar hook-associated protein FlgK [Phycisphaerae bacterium]
MSLTGALNIGKNALAINQAAIQTIGNNISNVGNANYTRQRVDLATARDQKLRTGVFVGSGVQLDGIRRQIDDALEGRLRNTNSESQGADVQQQWFSRVESVFNELSNKDLSTQLSGFFNAWNGLANKPQDLGLRQVVLQSGSSVTSWFHQMSGNIQSLRGDLNDKVRGAAVSADQLASKIASLNVEIARAEAGLGSANGLRDQRDALLKGLSEIVEIRTVEQGNGVTNVYVGSDPLVFDGRSLGVTTVNDTDADGNNYVKVIFKSNNGEIKSANGQLGGFEKIRTVLNETNAEFDELASALAFELNKVHSSGQGLEGFTSVIGSATLTDTTVALNDPASGLRQVPAGGSFVVHVKDKASGLSTSTLINIDLDGQGADTSLDGLITQLDAVDGITAVSNGGRLQISADNAPATEISFSQDSSGALAALGVNTFFTGTDAGNIEVSAALKARPQLLAAARNGDSGDNQTARAIAALETQALASLGGSTLQSSYEGMVNTVAIRSTTASADAEASAAALETMQGQHEALSGVSLDEEAINLMKYQRAFQGAARLVSVVNDMMDTMLGLVR